MSASVPRPIERRRNSRHRALLAGKLAGEDTATTFDCTIRNLSDTGAMVDTSAPHLLPARLQLMQIKDGVVWDAEVIWRGATRVGLKLNQRHDLRDSDDQQLRALRAIWSQMALR